MKATKPKPDAEIPMARKAAMDLIGVATNLRIISEFTQETRDKIKSIRRSGVLLSGEYTKLDEIDNGLLSVKIELQDLHPVPKEIEAALTERERQ